MTANGTITLYHSPNTRSSSILLLLEELGAPYELKLLNLKAGEHRQAPFIALNPMGKVPAIEHNGVTVTEQIAILIYLSDLFPETGLAPALRDPLRGSYLQWIAFYAGCFEPAIIDRARKIEEGPASMLPYGNYDTMLKALAGQLAKGPWLLGERFTAAEVIWGSGLRWTTMWKLVPELPEIKAYLARFSARPAVARAEAKDAELAASLS
ncbi:MAG: glutathione S-transferase family protein [Rhodomicrobium sp.]